MDLNQELRMIAEERIEEVIDAIYDEYLDELCAHNEMMELAAHSYDMDARHYGEY